MKTFKPVWFLLRLSRIEIKSAVWNVRFVYSKHAIRHTEGQEFIKLLGLRSNKIHVAKLYLKRWRFDFQKKINKVRY